MRIALLRSTLALGSLAAAQVFTQTLGDEIREAYTNFRTGTVGRPLVFELKGWDVYGKTATPLHARLYWKLDYDPRTRRDSFARVELDVLAPTKDGGERYTMRIVGDGVNLYRYDLDRGEVTTTTYGFYGPNPPEAYAGSDAPKLLAQLRTAAPGPYAYLVRLLSEINPSDPSFTQRYTDWLPGRKGLIFDFVPKPLRDDSAEIRETHTVTDPITGRVFVRGFDQAQKYAFYGLDRLSPDRTAVFTMMPDPDRSTESNPIWVVQSVDFAQRMPGRMLDLALTPKVGAAPDWAFAPYTGTDAARFRPMNAGGR